MAHSEEVVRVHLVIWIRKALHRAVKLYCLNHETAVMEFVIEAIQEKLATSTGSWSGSPPMVEGRIDGAPKGLRANPQTYGADEGTYAEEWTPSSSENIVTLLAIVRESVNALAGGPERVPAVSLQKSVDVAGSRN